jgi:hypothetical protein
MEKLLKWAVKEAVRCRQAEFDINQKSSAVNTKHATEPAM